MTRVNLEGKIRQMSDREVPWVLRQESTLGPWNSAEDFTRLLRRRRGASGIVAVSRGQILGYCLFVRERHHIRLLSLWVDPHHRRVGIGSGLLNWFKENPHREVSLTIEVPDTWTESHLFLRSNDFVCVRTVTDSFRNPSADGYLFTWRPSSAHDVHDSREGRLHPGKTTEDPGTPEVRKDTSRDWDGTWD